MKHSDFVSNYYNSNSHSRNDPYLLHLSVDDISEVIQAYNLHIDVYGKIDNLLGFITDERYGGKISENTCIELHRLLKELKKNILLGE